MNNKAIDYFENNKDKYPRAVLVRKMLETGYLKNDVLEAADFVFGSEGRDFSPGELDEYEKPEERVSSTVSKHSTRVGEFILGMLSPWIIGIILGIMFQDDFIESFWLFGLAYVAALITTFRIRRSVFRGMLANFSLIGGILFMAACLLSLGEWF